MATIRRNQQYFPPPSTLKVRDEMLGDRLQWNNGLQEFVTDRYYDAEIADDTIKEKVGNIMLVTHLKRKDGQYIEGIRYGDVVFSRAAMSTGTAGGKDGLVGEIWKTIPYAMMLIIWFYFRLRAEYGYGEVSEAWRTLCLMGLPKTRTPLNFGDFRYICKSPVLQKLYLKKY